MFWITVILFAIAASLGIFLVTYVLANKNTPKGVAFIHGSIAGLAIVLLIIYAFMSSWSFLTSALLFILAACGGFYMMYRDLTGKSLPKALAVGHGLLAITAFIILIGTYFWLQS